MQPWLGQPHAVRVVASTVCDRRLNSHGVFDFEAAVEVTRDTFPVLEPAMCVRNGTSVFVQSQTAPVSNTCHPLLRLLQDDGLFWVDPSPPPGSSTKPWVVVRDMLHGAHHLCEGDVVKLGRVELLVRQLVGAGEAQPDLRLGDPCSVCGVKDRGDKDLEQTPCRVCLQAGPGEDDPLIAPCSCRGSIEYVHLGCLRAWIGVCMDLSASSAGSSYFFRPMSCNICNAVYPTYVQNDVAPQDRFGWWRCSRRSRPSSCQQLVPLVEVPRTEPPFIVLEELRGDSPHSGCHGLHVTSLAERALELGRSKQSDVRIIDWSVSRCHATIRFEQGRFLLEDKGSRFGTLVAMRRPCLVEPSQGLSVQVGRTVLSLSVQPDLEATRDGSLQLCSSGTEQHGDAASTCCSVSPRPCGPPHKAEARRLACFPVLRPSGCSLLSLFRPCLHCLASFRL